MPPAGDVPPSGAGATRRRLMLGAAAASTVVTIRPALAATVGSVMNCEVPVPDPRLGAGKWIDGRGQLVDAGTAGSFRPPNRPLKAEDIRKAMQGANFPGADYETSRAYMAYIRKLQNGMSGFTCYQSLQMPRA
ncbi:hypothetical protein FOY91_13105 [Sphingomonas solaris]|uniref:Uncharacterized protein n=2 Tax=Alterirhizorhabdus solaris TaxID=2529389 RepID=A0A558R0W5_9SPHN|nr:hypothetical protein [Sphingomonas solaris]TVV73016.1 hypothetical protein FOY91_13105 [Sphingomonas solaris]